MLHRFGEPSKMDTAPYGSICKVATNAETFEIYCQTGHDEENPNWVSLGSFKSSVTDEDIKTILQNHLLP